MPKTTTVTAERVRECFNYDPETGIITWKKAGKGRVVGSECGHISRNGYVTLGIGYRSYRAHRIAWLYVHGVWPVEIDHINGVKTDNRIANLREATRTQNKMNVSRNKGNTSGYKGVSHCNRMRRWKAIISIDGKVIHIGRFDTAEEAAAAYNEAGHRHYGEFFRPNDVSDLIAGAQDLVAQLRAERDEALVRVAELERFIKTKGFDEFEGKPHATPDKHRHN